MDQRPKPLFLYVWLSPPPTLPHRLSPTLPNYCSNSHLDSQNEAPENPDKPRSSSSNIPSDEDTMCPKCARAGKREQAAVSRGAGKQAGRKAVVVQE